MASATMGDHSSIMTQAAQTSIEHLARPRRGHHTQLHRHVSAIHVKCVCSCLCMVMSQPISTNVDHDIADVIVEITKTASESTHQLVCDTSSSLKSLHT